MNTNNPDIYPPMYPFDRFGCDTYGYCGCYPDPIRPNVPIAPPPPPSGHCDPHHHHHPDPHPGPHRPYPPRPHSQLPSSGPMCGNAFITSNNTPFLYDNKLTSYGPYITYSESVITKVVRKNDISCLNISATLDMTDSMLTNGVLNGILTETITSQYESLRGVLPIIKSGIVFKLYYKIIDFDGCVVRESSVKILAQDMRMHFTDIRDKFVFSCKNIMVSDIQNIDYRGSYTITFERMEAYVETINTNMHLQNNHINPYYEFSDNNMHITLNHEVINKETPDGMFLFAECKINTSFIFQANVTTRLKFSFTAFIPSLTVTPNTFAVWSALNDPRNAELRDLAKTVEELSNTVDDLRAEIASVRTDNEALVNRLTEAETTIERLSTESTTTQTKTAEIDERVTALETVPPALLPYKKNTEFTKSQITWVEEGELYQATTSFTASGNITADVASGYLVPVSENSSDLSVLTEKVNRIETAVNESYSNTQIDTFLNDKVDKIAGKGLSSNDFTDEERDLLHSITQQIQFSTYVEFPNIGAKNTLYIATDKELSYIWDEVAQVYVNIDKNNVDADTIQSILGEANKA